MKRIRSNESFCVVIKDSDEFLRFCNITKSRFSSSDQFNSIKFLDLTDYIDSSDDYVYPILITIDLDRNYIPVDFRIERLSNLSKREMDCCLPALVIGMSVYSQFMKHSGGLDSFELSESDVLTSDILTSMINTSLELYRKLVPTTLDSSISLPDKPMEFNKERVMWDLIEKKDILPVLLHFKNMSYVNINHIVSIDSDNLVYLSNGSIIKSSPEEISNLHKLYSHGSSSLPCDCVSASKFGMIINLSRN